ncbi:MAG: beta-lactamase family protein [Erythrobacter sp.]|nr:beta-lactamase family protein [Erythrobacter sp.]
MGSQRSIWARLLALALLAGLTGFATSTGAAQDAGEPETQASDIDLASLESYIDGYVGSKIADMQPTGITLAVVTPEGTIAKGYGIANMETGEAVTRDTLFRIGSISKLFVWLSAHMLAEEGKIDLDADVNTYFDGFAIPDAYGKPITMRDLMAHRPGFEDNVRDFIDPERDITLEQAISRAFPARVAPPGERTSYSNSGTNIAAYVVERASGMDYFDFVRSRILAPAGMTSTSLRDPGTGTNPDDLDARTAKPHSMEKGIAVPVGYLPLRPQEAVGAASMSARDAATFLQLLLNGTELENGERLLSEESWARIATHAFPNGAGSDDVSWGFMLNDIDGATTIGHGGTTKFHSWLFIVPEKRVGVFVSSNMGAADTSPAQMAKSIIRRIAGTNALAEFQAREGDVEAAQEVVGTYLNNRRPFYGVTALFSLGSETDVSADDGFLVLGEGNRFAPLGNDVWVGLNGFRLRVDRAEDGTILRLHTGAGTATYERVTFWQSTRPLLIAIGLSVAFSITTLLGMWYRIKRTTNTTKTGRRAMWIALVSALLWLAFLGLLAASAPALADPDFAEIDKSGFPLTLTLALATLVALAVQAALHAFGLYWVWRGSGWGWWRRTHYTLFAIVFAFAMIGMAQLGAIGASITGA